MQRYNMDGNQSDNSRDPADGRLRFNNPQGWSSATTNGDEKSVESDRHQLLYDVTGSRPNTGAARLQSYQDQNGHHRPSDLCNSFSSRNGISGPNAQCLYGNANNFFSGNNVNNGVLCSKGWNGQSDSNGEAYQLVDDFSNAARYSNNSTSQSQGSYAYRNTSDSNSVSTNQQHGIWNSDATFNSSIQDIYNASSSYNDLHGSYAMGNATLTDHSTNIPSSSMTMPKSTECSKQSHQSCSQNYSLHQTHSQQTHKTYAQQTNQSCGIQQMNQSQNQQLMFPNQSTEWNLGVSQPLLQTNTSTKDLSDMQGQQMYQLQQPQFGEIHSPRKLLSRKNDKRRLSHKDQAKWGEMQPLDQDLNQLQWNQSTSHDDTHLNKYQRMQRRQTQLWRQQHADRMYQLQTQQFEQNQDQQFQHNQNQQFQQNQTVQQQQNSWTQSPEHCQLQKQLQQNQKATQEMQNGMTPLQRCQTQQMYQSPNQQLDTGLTPILKDLRFPTTQTLRFSDAQNQLEMNLTPILKDDACSQGRDRRVYQANSSTPKTGAQKELFQHCQPTWSDRFCNENSFNVDRTNNFVASALWNGEQKENLPECPADKTLMVSFDVSNNKLTFKYVSNNQQSERNNTTSSEFDIDARTVTASNSSSFLQQPSEPFNSGLIIPDRPSADQQANQIIFDNNSAAAASCANGLKLEKTDKKTKKMYTCEFCGKVFPFRSSWTAHRLRHLDPTKRYGCPTCDSKFSDRSALTKHMRVHTGEQPFECETCGSRFSQAGNLRRHERKTHLATEK